MFAQDKNQSSTLLKNDIDDVNSNHLINLTPKLFKGFWGDLFDSLPEGVLILNHNRDMLLINNKMHQLWGFPSNIRNGPESLDAIIDQVKDPVFFRRRIEEILSDQDCESQEIIKLKDGRIYQRNTKPLIIAEKNVGRFWTYRDISDDYRIEQALRKSEARYRILYDEAQRSNNELELLNRVRTAASEKVEMSALIKILVDGITEVFGYEPTGFYSLKNDILHLEYQVGYAGKVIPEIPIDQGITGRTARSKKPHLIENVGEDPDFLGSIPNVVSEISVPILDRDEVIGVLNVDSVNGQRLTLSDLNLIVALCEQVSGSISRAHLYSEVKTQEEQLQNIFELAPISMAITAADGSFVRVNKAFESLLGYSPDSLKRLKVSDITHPDDLPKNTGWGHRLLSGEVSSYQFEKRYIHKDGSIIDALLKVSLLPTEDGQSNQHIAQIVDLTALKQAERALLQHQKMESIGILAGGIAHDFNNLLVALKAQSSLALMKLPAESKAKIHIQKTKMAADSAAQLTEQLLAYSGQSQFKIEQINLNREIYKNSQLIGAAIPKNVQLQHQLAPNLPTIIADNGQVQQILMNLIINGAESLDGRPGAVTISTEEINVGLKDINNPDFILPILMPGPFISISIKDNGAGMDNDTLLKIFDPFFTTKFTGRGLGLAAVLGIVKSHNGGLFVTSKVGSGTTFNIYFPISTSKENIKKSNNVARNRLHPAQTKHKLITKSVLLIDDDEFVCDTIIDLFQFEGLPIVCASNGQDGVALLKENRDKIGLTLLDLSMPGISIEDTFTQLREINPELPILLCSGFSELKVDSYFLTKNYQGFIAKPFDNENLIKTVLKYLDP